MTFSGRPLIQFMSSPCGFAAPFCFSATVPTFRRAGVKRERTRCGKGQRSVLALPFNETHMQSRSTITGLIGGFHAVTGGRLRIWFSGLLASARRIVRRNGPIGAPMVRIPAEWW